MYSLPTSTVRIDLTGSPIVVSTKLGAVIGAVPQNGDKMPFVCGNARQALERFGYCDVTEYVAMHIQDTHLPIVVLPLPASTPGALTAENIVGNTGTSDCTPTAPPGGTGRALHIKVKVVVGGTIGTDHCVIAYSLNGGEEFTNVRLGLANTYTIPYVGVKLSFGAGDLVAGETVVDAKTTAPAYDNTDFTAAIDNLGASSLFIRNLLVIGDVTTAQQATYLAGQAERYETQFERYIQLKCYAQDHKAQGVEVSSGTWQNAIRTLFAGIDGVRRLDIGGGCLRRNSPIANQVLRYSVQFADNIRAFQHDLHVATWEKDQGSLVGWGLEDNQGNVVEHDERVWPGLLAGKFTCVRTWGNGPKGAYIAMSLTRAADGSPLGYSHNSAVANLYQTVCQASTEYIVGKTLVLNKDGTATSQSLAVIRNRVESDLRRALLEPGLEGQKASSLTWEPAQGDKFNVPDAVMHGIGTLNLRGTVARIETLVKVQ